MYTAYILRYIHQPIHKLVIAMCLYLFRVQQQILTVVEFCALAFSNLISRTFNFPQYIPPLCLARRMHHIIWGVLRHMECIVRVSYIYIVAASEVENGTVA